MAPAGGWPDEPRPQVLVQDLAAGARPTCEGRPVRSAQAMTYPDADPVGSVEIAARRGVTRSTVDQWRQRDLGFPAPRWTVGGRPAWEWYDVLAWLYATGRLA